MLRLSLIQEEFLGGENLDAANVARVEAASGHDDLLVIVADGAQGSDLAHARLEPRQHLVASLHVEPLAAFEREEVDLVAVELPGENVVSVVEQLMADRRLEDALILRLVIPAQEGPHAEVADVVASLRLEHRVGVDVVARAAEEEA